MGCFHLPTTFRGWAEYCDCLEPTKQFQYQNRQLSENVSQVQSNTEKDPNLSSWKERGTEKRTNQVTWDKSVVKYASHDTPKKGKELVIRNVSKKDTIEELSDIPEVRPQNPTTTIFDSRFDEEQHQEPSNILPKLYDPVALMHQDKRARMTAPLVQHFLKAERDSDQNQANMDLNLHNMSLFLDKGEQEQFDRKS